MLEVRNRTSNIVLRIFENFPYKFAKWKLKY